jgi:outer membrane immunogenic protein
MKMLRRVTLASALLASTALFSNVALAADIIEEPPPMFSWSGFYIGAHAGVVWGDNGRGGCNVHDPLGENGTPSFTIEDCFEAVIDDEDSPNDGETVRAFDLDDDFVAFTNGHGDDDDLDFLAGLQIGVNQQYGGLVLGLEADVSGLFGNNGNHNDFEYFHTESSGGCDVDSCLRLFEGTGRVSGGDIDWLATFRGRVGVVLGAEGRGLIYGTGGLAVAGADGFKGKFIDDDDIDFCSDGCFFRGDDDDIEVGFAVGVGGEWAWTDTVSFGAEFLHVGFNDDGGDSLTFHGDDGRQFSLDNSIDDLNIVRVKLNLRFPPG